MFIKYLRTTGLAVSLLAQSMTNACADETPNWKSKDGTIPVTVNLSDVQTAQGPIYTSIQKRKDYMSMNGFGGIIGTLAVLLGDRPNINNLFFLLHIRF